MSYRRVALVSFCASALSHNLGFPAVSGSAVRYRLYAHWGLSPVEIGKTIAFCGLTFGLGGMVLGGSILFVLPNSVPLVAAHVPRAALCGIGALLWASLLLYLTLAARLGAFRVRGHLVTLPDLPMALAQVALAAADVAATASILWLLLPPAPGLDWLVFLGVYLAAFSAGLATNLPGGLGVFDSAVLFGLSPFLPPARIIAAIAVFRLYFYVIPLFLAGALFAGNEMLMRGRWRPAVARARWSEPDFAAAAGSGAVAVSGILLLGLGLLAPPALSGPAPDIADLARQAGQFVPSLIGALLIVMAVGLVRRVSLAWGGALCMLAVGAGFILGGGERVWPIGVLLLAALVLAPFRFCFYRRARMLSGPLDRTSALSLLALAVCGVALGGLRGHAQGSAFWKVVLSAQVPWTLRASVALVVGLALVALWLLLRPGRVRGVPGAWRRGSGC